MKTMFKQRWDQCVVPGDVALCVFAEAVLEDDDTPGLGVTRGPGVEREAGREWGGVVGWDGREGGGFGGKNGEGRGHVGVGWDSVVEGVVMGSEVWRLGS
jgi:hypothetical protein